MRDESAYREKKRRWQRFLYAYNTVMCFGLGPPMVIYQKLPRWLMRWPYEDPVMMGIYGTIVTSVGALSATALRNENNYERFLPVLYTQILYKSMACAFLAKELRKKEVPSWGLWLVFWFFAAYVAMLAQAIPWRKTPESA